jgi:hypothetical protein
MNTQVLIHLPTDLALRFRQAVPARNRSSFVRSLLEKYLPDTDEALYQAAKQVQAFDDANPEDNAFFAVAMMDGLDSNETFDMAKLNALCRN